MSSQVFAPGLLEGQVAVVNGGGSDAGRAIAVELTTLGAQVVVCDMSDDESERRRLRRRACWTSHGRIDTLVNAPAGEDFRVGVEGTWLMTHAVATKAMVPESSGGKVVTVSAGSPAARAALENLARVLSIEWARFDVKLTAIACGHAQEAAWLAAYLASPGGDYLSGAVLAAARAGAS